MPVIKNCETCGEEFSVKPYLAAGKRFCSPECKYAGNRVEIECKECGTKFWTWKSQLKYSKFEYCSTNCRYLQGRLEKAQKPTRQSKFVFKSCKVCDVVFRVPPTRKDTAIYCSRACRDGDADFRKNQSEKQSGEKSPRWTGGIYQHSKGYVSTRVQPGQSGWRAEHRVVMEAWMLEEEPDHNFLIEVEGRKRLHPDVHVHHIDKVRSNNARSNLLAVVNEAHGRLHSTRKKPEPWECWPSNPERW